MSVFRAIASVAIASSSAVESFALATAKLGRAAEHLGTWAEESAASYADRAKQDREDATAVYQLGRDKRRQQLLALQERQAQRQLADDAKVIEA